MENHIKEVQVTENLKIVIREWNNITPYVVHTLNLQTGGYAHGVYCESLDEAKAEFKEKVSKYIFE
jgi:hypothetical protein